MTTIEQSLGSWFPQVQGKYINEDWNAQNQGFGAQCWDLAANWSKFLGLPVINTGGAGRWPGWAGNMVDAFPQTTAIAAAYELIGPDQTMQAGDICVWGDSYWYYPATHVAVGFRETGGMLLCASQNSTTSQAGNPYPEWTTGPTTLQHLPKQGLIGLIRPRLGSITLQGDINVPATQGGLTVADINTLVTKLNELLDRTKPIDTSSGAVDLRQFIADGTRAAQKAAEQTAPINTASGSVDLRQMIADGTRAAQAADRQTDDINTASGPVDLRTFIAQGTRAAQASVAKLAGLEAALKAVIEATDSPVDLAAVTAAAEAGAAMALSNLTATVTIEQEA